MYHQKSNFQSSKFQHPMLLNLYQTIDQAELFGHTFMDHLNIHKDMKQQDLEELEELFLV